MTTEERKMKPNEWLDSSSEKGRKFLSKLDFHDMYYFESLAIHLTDFLRNTPVPILTTWDAKNKRIYFSIGKESSFFPVSTEISYDDYLTQVERWTKNYYPQYKVEVKKEVPLSDEEIYEKVREGYDLNDAILLTKEIIKEEFGMIERIYIMEDKFKFNLNNNEWSIRMSGILNKDIIPLSKFLKELRTKESDEEIREYILNNSFEISKINSSIDSKMKYINYSGMQMVNFFKINLPDLKDYPIIKQDRDEVVWGPYIVQFESDILRDDCMRIAKENGVIIQ